VAAYLIADVEVTDPVQYEEYKKLAPGAIAKYGGRYLARGGAHEIMDGTWMPKRLVILEFPDLERARTFYHSPEYAAAKAARKNSATGNFVIVEGL
jgi:uncharacterized protein (DUF1330 family)